MRLVFQIPIPNPGAVPKGKSKSKINPPKASIGGSQKVQTSLPVPLMPNPLPLADPTAGFRAPQMFDSILSLDYETKRRASIAPPSDKDPRLANLKAGVGPFHSLSPLDDATRDTTITFFGYQSPVFRARHSGDGQLYLLRALKNFRPTLGANSQLLASLEHWKSISHPSIVSLKEAFVIDSGKDE